MTPPVDDVSSRCLRGRKVSDQGQAEIGEVTDLPWRTASRCRWQFRPRQESVTGPVCSSRWRASRRRTGGFESVQQAHALEAPEIDAEDKAAAETSGTDEETGGSDEPGTDHEDDDDG